MNPTQNPISLCSFYSNDKLIDEFKISKSWTKTGKTQLQTAMWSIRNFIIEIKSHELELNGEKNGEVGMGPLALKVL